MPALRWVLLAILMAAPLAFGAVQAWAWGGVGVASAALLAVWTFDRVRRGKATFIWSPLYAPVLLVLLLAFFQMLSGSSFDPIATREATMKLLIYLLVFFLTQQVFGESALQSWRSSAGAITVYAFAIALFGIIQFFASPSMLYGVVAPRWGGSVSGSYVNHNHYAGLMEMLTPIVVATTLALPPRHPARPAAVFSVFICLASVLLCGSRGGMVALAMELVLLLAIFTATATASCVRRRGLLLALTLSAVGGASFLWLAPESIWSRWELTASSPRLALEDRLKMTADSLRMSRDHLARGVGLGAFETAYPQYQSVVIDEVIDYAHNDYAQFAAEAGFLGWILIPLAIGVFLFAAFRDLRARIQTGVGWLQVGASVGVCGILIHSFVDFNLHIPANAAWFSFCCALAVATRLGLQPFPSGINAAHAAFAVASANSAGSKEHSRPQL